MEIKIKLLPHFDKCLPLPTYATNWASGADVRAQVLEGSFIEIKPGERKLIPTGFCVEIPFGFELQVRPRSGLSLKTGLMILNAPGTIDADYRGEVSIIVGNLGNSVEVIKHGDRIAQLVLAPVARATFMVSDSISECERGSGGFGHTGLT
ncbi:MAG: dUTP diphosphatase [Oligoflexia bacterium]|nr:dUTP diphosphatase [Oligoflexia bacterium]MBF0367766.1 dUTP diphosphatase [Oligoflexia bacterium]